MAPFGTLGRWLGRRAPDPLAAWRKEWEAAAAGRPSRDTLTALTASLARHDRHGADLEVEREMLDALGSALDLQDRLDRGDLPVVETTHRAIGTDRCHFIAAAGLVDGPNQTPARLLLTNARLVVIGGPAVTTVPWHAATYVSRADRDLIVIRADRQQMYRLRCNTYGDALSALGLAAYLRQV